MCFARSVSFRFSVALRGPRCFSVLKFCPLTAVRIVAGKWRGRTLIAPAGSQTRPTADRVRQALFDMLLHAPWGGREAIEGAQLLDVFAGTGALGLEALSRGAAHATFIEHDRAALAALRANIAACRAERQCTVLPIDALAVPHGPSMRPDLPRPALWPRSGAARAGTAAI